MPGLKTEIRSRWTKDNLYFLFICPYHQLWLKSDPATKTETNKLWDWDVAEVFIGNDFEHIRRYKEFELSPQGEWVDLDINLDSRASAGGSVGIQTSPPQRTSTEMLRSGTVSCAFHGQQSTRGTAPGNKLRINLYRQQGPPPDRKRSAGNRRKRSLSTSRRASAF